MKLYPDAFNLFVAESGRLKTPASVKSYRYVFTQLQDRHPSQPVSRFTKGQLVAFCSEPGKAPGTLKHRRGAVQALFSWLAAYNHIPSNPAGELHVLVSPGTGTVRDGHWYGADVVSRIITSCPDDLVGRRDRVALMFGFMLGLRVQSMRQLTWDKFSPGFERLNGLVLKGNQHVSKDLPAQLTAELQDWALEKPESAVAVIPAFHYQGFPDGRLEPDWDAPLGHDGYLKLARRAGKRVGVTLTPHDMRRSYANMLEENGLAVTDIQRALNHRNVGTTSTYLDKNPNKAAAVTKEFSLDL